ncbi:MAG TPA: prephenate dehydratase domain-containing protein [Gaiellaceae bacterium]|nr:prephenate dehydratase domain-containing protein [Gaiellaceae bacterium]
MTEVAVVGYPGPEGSHSNAAAAVLAPNAVQRGLPSFAAVVEAASACDVEVGVLPIESSLIGPITETHDLLFRSALSIVREATLPITHCVAGLRGAKLSRLRVLRSHPAAFEQCKQLLRGWDVQVVPSATTADAAREVAESGDSDVAAIGGEEAARVYGLDVLARDVGDKPAAFTRFVALAPYTQLSGGPGWRTAVTFVTDHQPGALFRALSPLAQHGVNLVQLVSRPLPDSPWRYRFDAIVDGHLFDAELRTAFAQLRASARELRVFGSYAAERER